MIGVSDSGDREHRCRFLGDALRDIDGQGADKETGGARYRNKETGGARYRMQDAISVLLYASSSCANSIESAVSDLKQRKPEAIIPSAIRSTATYFLFNSENGTELLNPRYQGSFEKL
jgi:hypothetical protein